MSQAYIKLIHFVYGQSIVELLANVNQALVGVLRFFKVILLQDIYASSNILLLNLVISQLIVVPSEQGHEALRVPLIIDCLLGLLEQKFTVVKFSLLLLDTVLHV